MGLFGSVGDIYLIRRYYLLFVVTVIYGDFYLLLLSGLSTFSAPLISSRLIRNCHRRVGLSLLFIGNRRGCWWRRVGVRDIARVLA